MDYYGFSEFIDVLNEKLNAIQKFNSEKNDKDIESYQEIAADIDNLWTTVEIRDAENRSIIFDGFLAERFDKNCLYERYINNGKHYF